MPQITSYSDIIFHHQVSYGLNAHTFHKIRVYSLPPTLVKVEINVKALLKFHQSETQISSNYETLAMRIKYILLGRYTLCYDTSYGVKTVITVSCEK